MEHPVPPSPTRWSGVPVPVAAGILCGACVVAAAHQALLGDWLVDDAAISFAFARNLADGVGLVAVPGGERVEGFSNPLHVLLLAAGEVVGLDGFATAKPMALAFTAVALACAWRATERALPWDVLALGVPVVLALDARLAIWSASGLENALYAALLAGGLLAFQLGRTGAAGLLFAGLALTRPEALGVGLLALGWSALAHGRASLRLAAGLLVPVLAVEALRLAYFAWPLPNTFYAKVQGGSPLAWDGRGWTQLRAFVVDSGVLFASPLLVLALAGRSLTALSVGAVLAAALLGPWPLAAIAALAGLGVALPTLAERPMVGLCGHVVAFGAFYAVWVDGDWMHGHRWFSLLAVPIAVLLVAGLREGVDAVRGLVGDDDPNGRTAWIAGVVLLGPLAVTNLEATRAFAARPVDWPAMVARRIAHTDAAAKRLGIERFQVSTLEMDMGAHLMGSPYEVVDLAGLVDVPIARHRLQDAAFLRQYVFEERRPLFAHVHRHWARASGIPRFPEWTRDYVELPPYLDVGDALHDGVFVRRDALLRPTSDLPPVDVRFGDVRLVGARLRSPEAGGTALVELAWRAEGPITDIPVTTLEVGPVRALVRLGYGWVQPANWGPDVFHGRVEVPVGDVCCGRLPVRLRAIDLGGELVPHTDLPVVDGAVVLPFTIEAVPDVLPYAQADREVVLDAASSGRCAEAEASWADVRAHGPPEPWADAALPGVRRAIASCWLAGAAPSVDDVVRARRWDALAPDVVRVGASLADPLRRAGEAARAQGRWADAYAAYADVLRVMPWDAWSRRRAEEARDAARAPRADHSPRKED